MSAELTDTGLSIEAFQTILDRMADDFGNRVGLTPGRIDNLKTNLDSTIGNMLRISAEQSAADQEALLGLYEAKSLEASGVQLDHAVRELGLERTPEVFSEVTGTITGTPAYSVENGVRFQFDDDDGDIDDGSTWEVVGGPYVIGGGGTVTGVTLRAETSGALEPGVNSTDWTLLDSIVEITDFDSTAQPIVGNDTETDAELRERGRIEAFSRAQGPLAAIEASVSKVDGVTFVRAWDNSGPFGSVDADSIPGKAINVVVEGGTDADVCAAIVRARSGGGELFGLAGPTKFTEIVSLGNGRNVVCNGNRVEEIPLWINIDLETSTGEVPAPVGIIATVEALVLARAPLVFGIGDDVQPWRLEGEIYAQNYPGIGDVTVTLSLDGVGGGGGSTDPYTDVIRAITIRQKSTYDALRIAAVES